MRLEEQIESLIDGYGLNGVLDAMCSVCHEKAEHLRANWQDGTSAKEWDKAGKLMGATRIRVEQQIGIPQGRKGGAQ